MNAPSDSVGQLGTIVGEADEEHLGRPLIDTGTLDETDLLER